MLLKPIEVRLHGLEKHARLGDAVRLPWEYDHSGLDALTFQRVVVFVALRYGHADIGVAMLDQRRRGDAVRLKDGRMVQIDLRIDPEFAAEVVGNEAGNIGGAGGARNGGE